MSIFQRSRSAIGVDVGGRTIKVAQLSAAGKTSRIAAISVLPRTAGAPDIDSNEIAGLRRIMKRQGFRDNRLVVAAPEDRLLRGVFDLPARVSGAPVTQIARMELARIHGVAPDALEIVCWEPPSADKPKAARQAVALGCTHETINTFVDLFERSGFDVRALDVRSAAAARACEVLALPAPAVTAILDLGWHSTKLLFVSGRALIYERMLDGACLSSLASGLSERFGISGRAAGQIISSVGFGTDPRRAAAELDAQSIEAIRKTLAEHFDSVIAELKVPFTYASHQYGGNPIERMLLIGGGAKIPGVAQHFQNNLGVETMSAAPSDLMESPPDLLAKAGDPALTVAVGLARFEGHGV